MSTLVFPNVPRRSLLLWTACWRALQPLRPSCSRTTTFLWLVVALAALCLRPDLAGVTSLVRGLGLSEASYYGLLHFFHSPALNLELLTRLWQQTLQRLFRRRLVRVHGRAVVLVDGLKRPKEGRKMPGVKSLHQESRCNAKASFIMGHSLQAVAVLAQAAGAYLAVPVAARIHEGVVWSNRDRRTLLDKLGALLVSLPWDQPVTVVADAYYAAAKFAARPAGTGPSSGHAGALQRGGLFPSFTPQRQTTGTAPPLRTQIQTSPMVSLRKAIHQGTQPGLWGIGGDGCAITPLIYSGASWAAWSVLSGLSIRPADGWFCSAPI